MGTVRDTVKKAWESAMTMFGLDRVGSWLRRGGATVLTYHNVVPDSARHAGESALHLPLRRFSRQLDAICRLGPVRPLKELLDGVADGDVGGHAFALTFDDAYRGAVTLAVRELERRGLPATIFVAPALLGDRTFWWDALLTPTEKDSMELRRRILDERDGTLEGARRLADANGLEMQRMPDHSRSATEAELLDAATTSGITIGSHTWSHASLVRLQPQSLSEEIARPREWLRARFASRYLDVLAYPYGLHSPAVEEATRAAGYEAGFTLTPGSIPLRRTAAWHPHAFRLPRVNVPAGLSPAGLRIKAAWS